MFNYASRRRFVKIVNLMGLLQALFSGDGLFLILDVSSL
jgi:hypothetical protein